MGLQFVCGISWSRMGSAVLCFYLSAQLSLVPHCELDSGLLLFAYYGALGEGKWTFKAFSCLKSANIVLAKENSMD
jgi:hypothetical protein